MIVQNTRLIQKRKFPKVLRCIDTGTCGGQPIITVGSQDKKLYVLDTNLDILQTLEFPQWVRCVALGDLTGDGNDEIATGSGDRSFRIYQFQEGAYKELYYITFDHFVDSVVIADIDGDDEPEIITGSWDQEINVFKLYGDRLSLLWTKKFDQRISSLKVGDTNWNGHNEIVALFKGGGMAVIDALTMEELWSFESEKDLLACDIGALEASGLPNIVVGGNDKILYFFDCEGKLVHQKTMADRITALNIQDIDGDGNCELAIAEGSTALRVFKMYGPDLYSLDLKWSKKIHHAVTEIVITDITNDHKAEIIYGGYSGRLTVVQDFFFGEEAALFTQNLPPYRDEDLILEEVSIFQPAVASQSMGNAPQKALNGGDPATVSAKPVELATGGDIDNYVPMYHRIYTQRFDRLFSGKSLRQSIQEGFVKKKLKQPYPTPYYRKLAKVAKHELQPGKLTSTRKSRLR